MAHKRLHHTSSTTSYMANISKQFSPNPILKSLQVRIPIKLVAADAGCFFCPFAAIVSCVACYQKEDSIGV
jgi:hypothetical protein